MRARRRGHRPQARLVTVREFWEQYGDGSDSAWRWFELSEEVCAALLEGGFAPDSLLLSKGLPEGILRRLAGSDSPRVRAMVADKRGASALLGMLARDPDASVRARVARNSRATNEVLEALHADQEPLVRAAAQRAITARSKKPEPVRVPSDSPWSQPLRAILDVLRDRAADDESSEVLGIVESAQHLLDHGEPKVALENLCSNLFEYDVFLSAELFTAVKDLAMDLKLSPADYEFLKERVTE